MGTGFKGLAASSLGLNLTSFSDDLAKKVVDQADPTVRDVLKEQRTELANAFLAGLPYVAAAGVVTVATNQLAPPIGIVKSLGYVAAIGLGTFGVYKTFSDLAAISKPPPPPPEKTIFDPIITQAYQTIMVQAEPKIRKLVDEERSRLATAAQSGLPWMAGGAALFAATFFLLPLAKTILKTAGYTAAIGLLTAGAWIGFEKVKSTSSAP